MTATEGEPVGRDGWATEEREQSTGTGSEELRQRSGGVGYLSYMRRAWEEVRVGNQEMGEGKVGGEGAGGGGAGRGLTVCVASVAVAPEKARVDAVRDTAQVHHDAVLCLCRRRSQCHRRCQGEQDKWCAHVYD